MLDRIKRIDRWINEKLTWIKWYNKMLIMGLAGVLAYLLRLGVLRVVASL